MGDGKTNPFNPDGKSGASGNSGGGGFGGMKDHRGPDRPQKMGASNFNADSVAPAGRFPTFDPPSDRDGLVTQKADAKGGIKHKPFKVGGKSSGGENESTKEAVDEGTLGEVGQVPTADESD